MTNQFVGKGSCLCGAVRFVANNMTIKVGVCHCSMCRKWSSGPYMEVNCGSNVEFSGTENITVYDSSAWADRGFCSICGSNLFYHLKDANEYMISVGLFSNDENLVFDHQVFIDVKPNYYSFSNKTRNMTSTEIFKMFASPPD